MNLKVVVFSDNTDNFLQVCLFFSKEPPTNIEVLGTDTLVVMEAEKKLPKIANPDYNNIQKVQSKTNPKIRECDNYIMQIF
ncbi:hypothetical protein Lal_00034253 [Lupinus albus]|nr:hypothetical protein Lal_00034253 [Lupinus albus]